LRARSIASPGFSKAAAVAAFPDHDAFDNRHPSVVVHLGLLARSQVITTTL
jgi:hypothetical protein